VFLPEGRLLLFYANGSAGDLRLELVEPSSGVVDSLDFETLGDQDLGGARFRQVEADWDGSSEVCVAFEGEESAGRWLQSRCVDLSVAGGLSFLPALADPADLISEDETRGFAFASDRAGTFVTLQYESTADGYEPRFSVYRSGAWEVVSGVLDESRADFETPADAAWTALHPEARPAIAHLQDQYFVGAWVRIDSTEKQETLLVALYDAEADEWGEAQALTEWSYTYRPFWESLSLATGRDGNLVLAGRYRAGENLNFTGTGLADGLHDPRRTFVFRYQSELGWFSAQSVGAGCTPEVSSSATGLERLGECTLPAQAVLLPSGRALVVFQDQDPSGRVRPVASEFR
jgi:hypothetical protein